MTKQEKEGTQNWTNARLLISHGKRQIFASKQEQEQKEKIVFFFRQKTCFPWNREWRMKRRKTFGEEKYAGRASEDGQERCSGSRWRKAEFFSSLTNKIKNLLQNKLHRPTKIG